MILQVEVVPVAGGEASVLRHLVDLYVYDFSELLGLDVGEDGRFAFRELSPYFSEAGRHPFFVRAGGKLAGFALVDGRSRVTGTDGTHDMTEFFILRRYRRQGVGERAARAVFDRFPGTWEVRQRPENLPAIAFWRRVIDRHTAGRFREVLWDDERWQGPVQFFTC